MCSVANSLRSGLGFILTVCMNLALLQLRDLMCGLNSAELSKGCMVVLWLDFFSLFSFLVCGF